MLRPPIGPSVPTPVSLVKDLVRWLPLSTLLKFLLVALPPVLPPSELELLLDEVLLLLVLLLDDPYEDWLLAPLPVEL